MEVTMKSLDEQLEQLAQNGMVLRQQSQSAANAHANAEAALLKVAGAVEQCNALKARLQAKEPEKPKVVARRGEPGKAAKKAAKLAEV